MFESMSLSSTESYQQSDLPRAHKFLRHPAIGRIFRFFSWWLIFGGIYASSSVCPFCGRPACPVGAVGAGVVGGCFSLVWTTGQAVFNRVAGYFSPIRSKLPPKPKA